MITIISKKKSFISIFLIGMIWFQAIAMYIPTSTNIVFNQVVYSSPLKLEGNLISSSKVVDNKDDSDQIKSDFPDKIYNQTQDNGGGPSTPEVQGFATASSDQLVNVSTGDFNYNIPLMEVGGFPINIAYNSNITPHEDASWVGLGWALNPGSVNRVVRGLPDDFDGAKILKEAYMKPKNGFSVGTGLSLGYSGFDNALGASLGIGLDLDHNNYDGWGVKLAGRLGLSANANFGNSKMGGSIGLGLGIHSRSGGYMSPSIGLNGGFSTKHTATSIGLNGNLTIDSREGFKEANFGVSSSMKLIHANDHLREEGKHKFEDMRNMGFTDSNFPLGFASPSYSPTFDIPMHHHSQAYRLKSGGTLFGVTIEHDITGTIFNQTIQNQTSKKAYGYINSQNATNEDLLDFNRENEGVYYNELPNLPITSATFDIYQVNSHISGGSYRPYRMDIGTNHDPYIKSTSSSFNLGLDSDGGNIVHVGLDIKGDQGGSENRMWTSGNPTSGQLIYRDTTTDPLYTPVYFKNPGELTAMEDTVLYNHFGKNKPARFLLHQADLAATADVTNKIDVEGQPPTALVHTHRTKREYQNTQFQYRSYLDLMSSNERNYENLINESRLPHFQKQIAEISLIDPGGTKSVFGRPAVNITTKEVSFDIQNSGEVINTPQESSMGLVGYTDEDASIGNRKGEANYFSSTTTPAYAYAWHITSLLSDDYVDVSLDGPTPEDLGSYTLFEYNKVHENFKWRMPLDSATFQELRYHTAADNKASYTYGEKEIFHISQIKTRNYVAIFYSSPRNDGHGVRSEAGGIDFTKKLHKLDSIQLFTTAAYAKPIRVPIKTVHFEYDYSLNQGQRNTEAFGPDRQTGKLTLKKLYFTYQNSKKHKESPYKFEYRSPNPTHHPESNDRWGYYKPNNPARSNSQEPYTIQDKAMQDINARAWLLTDIHMPIGGKMTIEYESDDYAYVQDRRAMRMMALKGVSHERTLIEATKNQLGKLDSGAYLFFELPSEFPRYREPLFEYFNGIKELYFKVNVGVSATTYEQISGFVPCNYEIADWNIKFGFDSRNPSANHFWIKIPWVLIGQDPEINNTPEHTYTSNFTPTAQQAYRHPFRHAAFQTLSTTLPRLIDPEPIESVVSETSVGIVALAEAFVQLGRRFDEVGAGGTFNYLERTDRCRYIDVSNSYLRLNDPLKRKMGGGARVKRIEIHDNWRAMQTNTRTKEVDFSYGVMYQYTLPDGSSSGVASYEPAIGKDENPFYMPIPVHIERKLGIDITNYQFEPVGELFYPSPQVIYARVTQRNNPHTGVTKHTMGYTISEYYTAKDFPTISLRTRKEGIPKTLNLPLQVYNRNENTVAVSQGFCVELNDMHGKQKSIKEYDENHNLITSSEYLYKTDALGKLDNYVTCINQADGSKSQRQVGITYDITVDANSYFAEILGGGLELNINVSMYGLIPVVIVMPIPVVNHQITEYRGITITKVITRNGILDRIISRKLGAINQTKNIAFDPKTGNPLVTEMDNEFDESYYSVNIPAYWAYPEMGHASQNALAYIPNATLIDGIYTVPNASKIFTPGDIVYVRTTSFSSSQKLWVFKVSSNQVSFINMNGTHFTGTGSYSLKIIQSGYKNKIAENIYSYTTIANPVTANLNLSPPNMIQASANTYSDYWQTNFSYSTTIENPTCDCSLVVSKIQLSQLGDTIIRISPNSVSLFDRKNGCSITISSQDGGEVPSGLVLNLTLPPEVTSNCAPTNYVYGSSNTNSGNRIFIVQSDCINLITCNVRNGARSTNCTEDNIQNPFLTGILGNYRPVAAYHPHVAVGTSEMVKDAGYLMGLSPFWSFNSGRLIRNNNPNGWERGDSLITVNQLGKGLESWNALNIPTASVFDYGDAVPTAVAANAYYNDILYDGYEGTDYFISRARPPGVNCSYDNHGKFSSGVSISDEPIHIRYDKTISHSGESSLKLTSDITAQINYPIGVRTTLRGTKESRFSGRAFTSNRSDLITGFSPRPGEKYIFSTWVYRNTPDASIYTGCQVKVDGLTFQPSGPIIDGWQQIKGEITTKREGRLIVTLSSDSGTTWFDDFRMQPLNTQMETYTYSSDNLRYMAKHDDQNYTSYFEYDSEGKLVRTKRETEVGVFTIMESRAELPKSNR